MTASTHIPAVHPAETGEFSQPWGKRTRVMGILNLTPDSFFDGGRHDSAEKAGLQALQLEKEGADWLDLGAESSRPGASIISEGEELRRLLPVIKRIRGVIRVPISVDTAKASVAKVALSAGATWINDIWGLQGDAAMASVVAEAGASVVIMHNQRGTQYPDGVVAGINRFFESSLRRAAQAGIPMERIVLDPGIGFGKTPEQNLAVLCSLREFRVFGRPLLLGASRKSVIGHVLDLPPAERLEGSLATTVAAVAAGVDAVRVHDVQAHVRAARMADAIYRGSSLHHG